MRVKLVFFVGHIPYIRYQIYQNMAKGDLLVRSVPIDILKIILKEQAKHKESHAIKQYSLSSTIFKIIREWKMKCGQ